MYVENLFEELTKLWRRVLSLHNHIKWSAKEVYLRRVSSINKSHRETGISSRASNQCPSCYVYIVIIALFVILVLPRHGFFYDEQAWFNWMDEIANNGLIDLYRNPDVNYLPLYVYLLQFFGVVIFKTTEARAFWAPYLKLVPLIFDVGTILVSTQLLKRLALPMEKVIFLALNLAFLYNTLIWGQIDGIPAFFILLALWFGINKKGVGAILAFLVAINIKIQAVVFAPIVILIAIPHFWKRKSALFKTFALVVVCQLALFSPFIITRTMYLIERVITSSVDFFPYISVNAFNFWILVVGSQRIFTPDDAQFILGLTYKNVGLGLFLLTSFFALLPILKLVVTDTFSSARINWLSKPIVNKIFLSAALCVMNFFYFNTQMHERYLHPAILFAAIAGIVDNFYLTYVLLSIGYLLNLEAILNYSGLGLYDINWIPPASSILLLVALVSGYYQLYRKVGVSSV